MHENAWRMVLEKAEDDLFYRYSYYTSRILAVHNPEIYLRADTLFLEAIQNNPGFRKSYEIKDVHSDYFYGENMTGPHSHSTMWILIIMQ